MLPGWTARFADPNFRDFAMETLCRELPAHVLPDFYWLDFEGMRHFEVLYRNWLEHLRRQESGAEQEADPEKAGERLAIFLARAQESDAHASRYWI